MEFKTYTKINGQLALFNVSDCSNHEQAIQTVKDALPSNHKTPILVLLDRLLVDQDPMVA